MSKTAVIVISLVIGIVIGASGVYFYMQMPSMNHSAEMHTTAEHKSDHKMIDVDTTKPAPNVQIKTYPDTMSGVNVQIITENFDFTPENVNKQNEANAGHAHLMVNGVKLARVYGEWFHIPADKLKQGENKIEVTLNANDHSEWAYRGDHIQAVTTVIVN
jgi:hypothetical protein